MSQSTAQKPNPIAAGTKGPVTRVGDTSHAAATPVAEAAPKVAPAPLVSSQEVTQATPKASAPATKLTAPLPRVRLEGYWHTRFDYSVPRGTNHADLLRPDYWQHVASQFKQGDTITARAEDGSWRADFEVVSADRLWAKVFQLGFWDLTKSHENMPKTQEEEYDVLYSPMDKFFIIKKGQENLPALKTGFQTKLEAYQWLDGHLKAINT